MTNETLCITQQTYLWWLVAVISVLCVQKFYVAAGINFKLKTILQRYKESELFRTQIFFDVAVKNTTIMEKGLMLDVQVMWETYKSVKVSELAWYISKKTQADSC